MIIYTEVQNNSKKNGYQASVMSKKGYGENKKIFFYLKV